jgi:hypothetical protein
MNAQMKSITAIALVIALLVVSASSVLAAGRGLSALCAYDTSSGGFWGGLFAPLFDNPYPPCSFAWSCVNGGGTWVGEEGSVNVGTCFSPLGTFWHDYVGCADDELATFSVTESETISFGCMATHARGAHCGPIDLPRIIEPSAATPIHFKGSAQVDGASLVIPGFDSVFPLYGLSYDWASKTWSGFVDTSNIPAGSYKHVRLNVLGKGGDSANCNIGGLTVID